MKKIIALLSIILIASCGQNIEKHKDYTVINWHKGGYVIDVFNEIQGYKRPIKIKGLCASACTYAFRYKDTCVYRNARVMFHVARGEDGLVNESWTDFLANQYPKKIREWFKVVVVKTRKDYEVLGQDLINIFGIKECKNG